MVGEFVNRALPNAFGRVWYWNDSAIALCYIFSTSSHFITFVFNYRPQQAKNNLSALMWADVVGVTHAVFFKSDRMQCDPSRFQQENRCSSGLALST